MVWYIYILYLRLLMWHKRKGIFWRRDVSAARTIHIYSVNCNNSNDSCWGYFFVLSLLCTAFARSEIICIETCATVRWLPEKDTCHSILIKYRSTRDYSLSQNFSQFNNIDEADMGFRYRFYFDLINSSWHTKLWKAFSRQKYILQNRPAAPLEKYTMARRVFELASLWKCSFIRWCCCCCCCIARSRFHNFRS